MKDISSYHKVGKLDSGLSLQVGCSCSGQIYAAPGVIKHIIKRHEKELDSSITSDLLSIIEKIIEEPDYFGKHPDKDGIEYIKILGDNIVVGLQIDPDDKYIYVSTLYPVKESKLQRRIQSGRYVKFDDKYLMDTADSSKTVAATKVNE